MHCGASMRELYGTLVFHNTTFSHLQLPRSSPPRIFAGVLEALLYVAAEQARAI